MPLADDLSPFAAANPGIAVAVARITNGQSETVYLNCEPTTRFEIGSITKVITAILLGEAVAQNRCSLHDALDKWLPPSAKAPHWRGRPITLQDLATHSSGLPRLPLGMLFSAFTLQPYKNWSRDRLLRALSRVQLERPPGSTYAYSNFGFALLGLALECVMERPYEDLVSDLTSRLNCPDLRLPVPEDRPINAQGHNVKGKAAEPWILAAFSPAGACTATLDAMIRFANCNLSKSPESFLFAAYSTCRELPTRPPFVSGIRRAVLGSFGVAAIAALFPQTYVVPILLVNFATLAGGILGGSMVALIWAAVGIFTPVSAIRLVARVAFSTLAILLGLPALGKKRVQKIALGWHLSSSEKEGLVWHNGGTAGFRSFIGLNPAYGTAIIVLSAQAKSVDNLAIELLRKATRCT